ncbi:MAG: DUF4214 domain-containing protein [Sulfitobacter sp.]
MPAPNFPYVSTDTRTIYEGDYISGFIRFKSGEGGYTYGQSIYSVAGTAVSGDFAFVGATTGEGQYPTEVIDSYSYTAFTDDRLEGTEEFYIVQYDIDSAGQRYDFDLITVQIIDTTSKTVFLDLNGDGTPDAVEISMYNYRNYVDRFSQKAQQLQDAERAVVAFIDENRSDIGRLEDEKKQIAADAFEVLDIRTGQKFDIMKEIHSTLEKINKSGESISEFFDDPTLINAGQAGVYTLDAMLEAAVIKKVVKSVIGRDVASAVLDGVVGTQLQLAEVDQEISRLKDEIEEFETVTLPGIDDSRQAFREATDDVLNAVFGPQNNRTDQSSRFNLPDTTDNGLSAQVDISGDGLVFLAPTSNATTHQITGEGGAFLTFEDGFRVIELAATGAEVATLGTGTAEDFFIGTETQALSVRNVDRVVLEDGYLAFDFDGNGGAAFRLYQAAFDRLPDAEGLGFWIDVLDETDFTLDQMAEQFLTSAEFVGRYGDYTALSDSAYLDILYGNILDRQPDPDGFDFWLDVLQDGYASANVLADFAQSEENRDKVSDVIDDGIWYV